MDDSEGSDVTEPSASGHIALTNDTSKSCEDH